MSKVICKLCQCPSSDRLEQYCTGDCYVYFDKNDVDVTKGKNKSDNATKPISNVEWEKSFNPKK